MKTANGKTDVVPDVSVSARKGVGSWIILSVLFSLLAATFVVVYLGSTLGDGTYVPTSGYVAMAIAVIVSLAFAFGLMGLIVYSSRRGYDEPPALIVREDDFKRPVM
jgi:hypothetical protein